MIDYYEEFIQTNYHLTVIMREFEVEILVASKKELFNKMINLEKVIVTEHNLMLATLTLQLKHKHSERKSNKQVR